MTTTRRIKAVSEIRTRAEFDKIVDDTVTMQISKERLEIRRDQKILDVRGEFDPDINDMSERMQANVIRLEKYATDHRDELLPGKKKSSESTFAFFGFRTGNPTLVLLNRKWTWKAVIAALKAGSLVDYIITKETPDKDKMKSRMTEMELFRVGTRIEQKEVFFVDPKRDPADPQRLVSEPRIAA